MAEIGSDSSPLEAQLPIPPVENEEEDVCRVCRVEGDEEMPLVYPCKCRGSVRYVHPDCLKSWLAASQKKHCEICGYKYNFTKVYPDYIPQTIPPTVYVRQGLMWLSQLSRRIFRLWIATNTWLILLPALNMSSLRTLLWATDFLTPSPPLTDIQADNATLSTNATSTPSLRWDNETRIAVRHMFTHPVSVAGFLARDSWTRWNAGEQDTALGYIFRGQALTLILAAVVLGLVLIREWMAQHVLTDPSKPADAGPAPRKPIRAMNGIVYEDRHEAYLACQWDKDASLVDNLLKVQAFEKAKRTMFSLSTEVSRLEVRLGEIQTYLHGNPFIGEAPLNPYYVKQIMEFDPDWTVGDLRNSSEAKIMILYPTAHGIIERLVDAKKGYSPGTYKALGAQDQFGGERNPRAPEDPAAIEKTSTDSPAPVQRPDNTLSPPIPATANPDETPLVTSPPQASTPPRPVNADDKGFGEHVSYTAPELLDETLVKGLNHNDDEHEIPIVTSAVDSAGGRSDPASGSEQLRQARLARFEKRQSRQSREEVGSGSAFSDMEDSQTAGRGVLESPVKLGESSRAAGASNVDAVAEDAEGWETDDSGGDPDRSSHSMAAQPSSSPSSIARDRSIQTPPLSELERMKRDLAASDLGPGKPGNSTLISNTQALFVDADGHHVVDTNHGYRHPVQNTYIPPDPNGTRYFIRDPLRPGVPHRPVDLPPLPAFIPPTIPGAVPVAPDDDAEDDAEDEDGEDEDEHEDEPELEAPVDDHHHHHDHEQEEMEELDREDWNGVLEVVGLIGPIQNLAQNVCFGFVIVGASMSILVGIPIWIGRLFLSVNYWHAATYSALLVIKGARLVFDPVLRVIYDILAQVVVMPALSSIMALEKIVADSAGLGDASLPKVDWLPTIPPVIRERFATTLGDVFAFIGKAAQEHAIKAYETHGVWSTRILTTNTLSHRLWTMGYGYAVIFALLMFIALDPAGFRRQPGGQVSGHVSDIAQYLKLAFFMFAELVIFPTTIGGVIQVCVVPLAPNWSLEKLLEHLYEVPFGTLFATWIIGTSFMFMFAGLLQTLRKMCRKGVLFFIRDPTERSYNPVKDILERPTMSQVRKLGISAVMYTIVAIFLFGATCWTLSMAPFAALKLLPLRTSSSFKSVSTVPFDLLFFSIAIGPTLTALRFGNRGRRWMRRWWDITANAFNLTYMLTDNDRTRKIESPAVLRTWRILDFFAQIALGKYNTSETWARVPAADSVVLLKPEVRKGRGVFVRLDNLGRPLTEDGGLLMVQQNQAAKHAKRDPVKDYKVVWLPRYWRTRIHAVVYTALALSGAVVATALLAPLIVGRLILDRAFEHPVHDGYNWLTGVYMIWAVYYLGQAVRKHVVLSRLAGRLRRSDASTRAKRLLMGALARTYVLTTLYLTIPSVVGIGWELYIAMPLRYGSKSYTPVLHFWEAWAMGLIVMLTYVAITHDSDHPPRGGIRPMVLGQQMRECYRTSFSTDLRTVHSSTYQFIGFFILIDVAPSLLTVLGTLLTPTQKGLREFSVYYRLSHPILLFLLLAGISRNQVVRKWSQLRQILIDAEYVLEERVENYEPGKKRRVTFKSDSDESDYLDNWEDVETDENVINEE